MNQYTYLTTLCKYIQVVFRNPVYMMWMYKHVYNCIYIYIYMDFTETVMPQLHPKCIAVVFFVGSQVHPWR